MNRLDPRAQLDPVRALASQALDLVMAPSRDIEDRPSARASYPETIENLCDAFRSDDPDMRRKVVSDLLGSGLESQEFILKHAGDTARRLGALWADNEISFAETTIGVARLQETVRALSARKHTSHTANTSADILMIVPRSENHLLGLFVVCEALQNMGCYTHVAIGQSQEEISALVQKQRFDMIGLSVSSGRNVKEAAALVRKLRGGTSRLAPIVLGGGLANDISKRRELLAETGADHVTSCPKEALRLCRIDVAPSLDGDGLRHTVARVLERSVG